MSKYGLELDLSQACTLGLPFKMSCFCGSTLKVYSTYVVRLSLQIHLISPKRLSQKKLSQKTWIKVGLVASCLADVYWRGDLIEWCYILSMKKGL